MKRQRTRWVLATLALTALGSACPAAPAAPCTSDQDCGAAASCVVADGTGTCQLIDAAPVAEGEGEPAEGEGEPAEGEGEPAEGEGEPAEGEGEPAEGEGEPGPLNLGRVDATGGGAVSSGATFNLRGALTMSNRASSVSFTASPRSAR